MVPLVPLNHELTRNGAIGATKNQFAGKWRYWCYLNLVWRQIEPLEPPKIEVAPNGAIVAIQN